MGDVNNDGKIDRKDAVLILKNISGITSDNFSAENADYNGDGAINSLDAIAIMKMYIKIFKKLLLIVHSRCITLL